MSRPKISVSHCAATGRFSAVFYRCNKAKAAGPGASREQDLRFRNHGVELASEVASGVAWKPIARPDDVIYLFDEQVHTNCHFNEAGVQVRLDSHTFGVSLRQGAEASLLPQP